MGNHFKESCVGKYYPNSAYYKVETVVERDPYLIVDDGKMSGFCFYDREAWDGSNWCLTTSNFSGNIWFGKRYTYEELLNLYKTLSLKDRLEELSRAYNSLPTYHSILKYMKENNLSEICIDRFHNFHELEDGDITYEELTGNKSRRGK